MQLTAREDIEAPLEQVFAAVSDFDSLERQVLRRGVDIQRTTASEDPADGLAWRARFEFRGKPREAQITLTEYAAPERLIFETESGGLDIVTTVDVVALSQQRTRVAVTAVLVPKTLSARLLVQSLKLAKGGVERKFQDRMKGLAQYLERRLQSNA